MAEQSVVNATIRNASRLAAGVWGDDSALTLVFELEDGRITLPTFIPGPWQVADLLEMFDVASIQNLVGASLRVVLLDPDAPEPTVTEVLASAVPEAFRQAFEGDS